MEFTNVYKCILGLELINCLLCDLGLDSEETIGNEELGVALIDVGLQGFYEFLGNLGKVTTLVEQLNEELLEG